MRIVGFFLGLLFLLLNSLVAVAQVTPQAAASVASSTGTTSQTQANVQETSRSKSEKDQSGSGGEHHLHLRLGTVAIGAGYSHYSGPGYYPYGVYPFRWEYSALWFPYWGPYPFFAPGYFAYGSSKGEVKLATEPKTAAVYLDRGYAGTADHLKNIWLEPGAYDLSLAAVGHEDFHQRIYVLSGKSVKITAKLVAAEPKPADAPGQAPDPVKDKL